MDTSNERALGDHVPDFHPLSCNQELLLAYSAQFGFETSTWNQQVVFHLNDIDEVHLAMVLASLSARHDILRTHLADRDGSHCQAVADVGLIPEHSIYGNTDGDIAQLEKDKSFDLLRAPLWRSATTSRPDGGGVLILTFNHLVTDGQSDRIFAREFVRLYDLARSGLPIEPPPYQYSEFSRWQRDRVAEFVHAPGAVPGWADFESSVRAMRVGGRAGAYAPAVSSGGTASIRSECTWSMSIEDTDRIIARAKSLRSSLNTLLVAALSTALARRPDIPVGLLIGERTIRYPHRFSDTLGPFPDPWPINTPLDRSTNFSDSVTSVRTRQLQAIDATLPFHVLLSRIPWLSREFREHGNPVKMFHQFLGDGEIVTPRHSRTSRVEFPATFGEHSDVVGVHTIVGLTRGKLRGIVAFKPDMDGTGGVDASGIDRLAAETSVVLGRECGHRVQIHVEHLAPGEACLRE